MSKIDLDNEIDEYFKKNCIEELPITDKDKLKLIRTIIFETKVTADQLEFNYQRYKEWYTNKVDKTEQDVKEDAVLHDKFNRRFNLLEGNIAEGLSYKLKLDERVKQKKLNNFFVRGIANIKGMFRVS